MRKRVNKPAIVSPIPATAAVNAARPVCVKRLGRVRMNWFVVGSVFGVIASFFMNFIITSLIMPHYRSMIAGQGLAEVAQATPPTKTQNTATETPATVTEAPPPPPPKPPISYPRTLALKIGKGDTLLDMLIANDVQAGDARQVVDALKPKLNPKQLRVGQQISVTLARHETIGDKAAVKELAINLPNLSTVELQRLSDGKFNVAAIKEELTTRGHRAVGKVRSSLSQAGADAGIPNAAMNEIIKAFSYDVDFQRDIHPNDTIEVLIDRKTARDGRVGGYGDLRYAALTLQGKKMEIFRFKDSSGDYAWYDAKGNSVKKSLLRTPLDAARITSGFGLRTHPIMGYTKFHRGVDFGAPSGTPIMAAGDGTVTFRGWKGGYGNFVTIRHNATYETAYGHISRFADINVGGRVKQGQVIAYVGSTGMSTGPHLHYEVHENDVQVNPTAKQFNMASGLTGKQLAAFKASKQSIANELASLKKAEPSQLASR